MSGKNLVSLFLTSLILQLQVLAQDTLSKNLKEVNIIASGTEKSILSTPRSVTVLTQEDLQKAPYLTLGNILEEQAGIYLIGGGQAPGSNQSIFLRGTNSNQTAIYVDGVRIQDLSTVNGVVDLSELPISDVVRVEILRGAQGTLYGSPAAGGVIRITTIHKGASMGWNGNFKMTGGLFKENGHDAGSALSLGYKSADGWYVQSSLDYFASGGFNATLDTGYRLPTLPADPDGWKKLTGSVAAGYSNGQTDFMIGYRALNSATDIDASAYTDDDNYTIDYRRSTYLAGLTRYFTDRFSMRFMASWTGTDRSSVDDSSLNATTGLNDRTYYSEHYTGEQLSAEISAKYVMDHLVISSGATGLLEQMNQQNYYYSAQYDPFIYSSDYNLDSITPSAQSSAFYLYADLDGGWVQERFTKLHWMGGIRFNHHSICGDNLSFEVSPSFQLNDDVLLYVSYSTGFTNPSLYQLYAPDRYQPWDGQSVSLLSRGNNSLSPEVSRSFEVGWKERINEKTDYSLSFFRSNTLNVIDYVYLWDGKYPVPSIGVDPIRDDFRGDRYLNIGEQTAYGIEFSFHHHILNNLEITMMASLVDGYIDLSGLSTDTAYHYQLYSNGIFLDEASRLDGLVRRPSTFRTLLEYRPLESMIIGLQVRFTGQRSDVYYDSQLGPFGALNTAAVNAYTLTDLSAAWIYNRHFRFNLRLENVFNVDYQEIYGFRTRGRGLQVSASYSF